MNKEPATKGTTTETPWKNKFCASVITVIPKSGCLCSNEFPCFTCKSAIPNFLCACVELVPHIIYFIGQAEHLKAFGGMMGFSSSPPDKMGWGEADSGNDRKKKTFPFKWWHAATVLRLQGLIIKGHPAAATHYFLIQPRPDPCLRQSGVLVSNSIPGGWLEGDELRYQLVSAALNTVRILLSHHRSEFL